MKAKPSTITLSIALIFFIIPLVIDFSDDNGIDKQTLYPTLTISFLGFCLPLAVDLYFQILDKISDLNKIMDQNLKIHLSLKSLQSTKVINAFEKVITHTNNIQTMDKHLFDFVVRQVVYFANEIEKASHEEGEFFIRSFNNNDNLKNFTILLEALKKGDSYKTVSTLEFWTENTLFQPNILKQLNLAKAKEGLKIFRLFPIFDENGFIKPYKNLKDRERLIIDSQFAMSQSPEAGNNISIKICGKMEFSHQNILYENITICETNGGNSLSAIYKSIYEEVIENDYTRRGFKGIMRQTNAKAVQMQIDAFDGLFNKAITINDYINGKHDA